MTTADTKAKRATISHAGHAHPSTARARAACRTALAEGKKPAVTRKAAPAAKKTTAAPAKRTPAKKAAPAPKPEPDPEGMDHFGDDPVPESPSAA